ncbi:Sec-independent protein translocase subunit TatA [Pseudonocardia kujensis]|uniref:Sec-independent protein translocase subunit TatA n=1 Tax=Pseudonocardia kujensis TaxID=1128675 RepID=UPI001E387DCF|nr:Sec-independent protein translocase subunit TatA [Pseudonocardia kujensis]MCE0766280.1 Sec-independent protein translocase subunit TatA [Pseudonocardia kujensis]
MGELSAWHWLIVIGVFVLLFGARKLPEAARGLGRSARILKAELRAEDTAPEDTAPAPAPPAGPTAPAAPPAPATAPPAPPTPAAAAPVPEPAPAPETARPNGT